MVYVSAYQCLSLVWATVTIIGFSFFFIWRILRILEEPTIQPSLIDPHCSSDHTHFKQTNDIFIHSIDYSPLWAPDTMITIAY